MDAVDILWVGLGGGIGSLLRWQIGRIIDGWAAGSSFKVGTFVINVTGAFLIAYISALLALGWEHRYGDVISSLVLTGVLGGYTTFSTMQLDAVKMAGAGRHGLAVVYLVVTVVAGLLAVVTGVALARA
ncbi:fluoride efflux transporter FluC [Azospirillum ramasamyi]|uniref:Fluoride-specific ion channel FluC n=1 Tax=Azospirillum ramasamyi TaxID=682998 RepID=A0A2U9S521_9PROT|nr:CrcB family protein [Azospirillum ramasamyi]AWU92988.1 chromosome condensation protein CrcB [Azospirillum ramasamyi]